MTNKIGSYVQVSEEFIASFPNMSFWPSVTKIRDEAYKKGFKVYGEPLTRSGISGDDFVHNMRTFTVRYDMMKIPRILNPLRNNKTRNRDVRKMRRSHAGKQLPNGIRSLAKKTQR